MLSSLTIKNIVLIDQLTINFSSGLCALTGETGAGKSILLDSLGLALGARADTGLVRHGSDQASVAADFDLPSTHKAFSFLKEHDLETDGEIVLRRVLTKEGKSKAFVNDQPISVQLLKKLGDYLIEVHGQFDTQHLLNPAYHLGLLDEYAGHEDLLRFVKSLWGDWKKLEIQLQETKTNMDKAREDEEFYRKSLEDLDALSPKEGEEDELSQLRERLMRREQILEKLSEAQSGLEEMESISGQVWRALDALGDETQDIAKAMNGVTAEMGEVRDALQNTLSDIENNEYSLEEIDERLFSLKAQARKHNCSVDMLMDKRDEIATLLNAIENQDSSLADLMRSCEKAKEDFENKAIELSGLRQKIAKKMGSLVVEELSPLKLEKARFEVSVEQMPQVQWGPHGVDKVQFLVATNPGATPGPIHKIASGGELSRFTLALKVILSETGVAQSLVFDEVDSGIGGATAAAVGERLSRLAQTKQILVVTHSPQVAAMAQNQWVVSKTGTENVRTNIIALDSFSERQEEIARMLAGSTVTDEARAAASKLLNVIEDEKVAS